MATTAALTARSHGFPEFQKTCEAVLMGRTTFEPRSPPTAGLGRT
jgi:hypothetical protein